MPDDLRDLATEAFIYGFPLVFNLEQIDRLTTVGIGALKPAPFNTFSHATKLAGPDDTFVSINNDTVYSIAPIDVSAGPVRLQVPDTAGRYYVLQFVDAWTNNVAYVGHRATGTHAGTYLLVAADWDGTAADGETIIRLPSAISVIVGRIAVDGDADLPAVSALQQGFTLTPTADRPGAGLPLPDPAVADGLEWFEKLRVWIQAFPPAARDQPLQERYGALGVFEPESPFVDPTSERLDALVPAPQAGTEQLQFILKNSAGPKQNGWNLTYHVFDYNLDFFEVGTLDDATWKIEDPKARIGARAAAALAGLWGNHGYEAAYAMVYEDGDGNALDGTKQYELHFPTPPPVGAFWSVTMYDIPDFFLVANPIGRYSIGDRTPGLEYHADGSLTLTVQHAEPTDPRARANWLPAPAAPFRPILRMYEPDGAVFDGSYELPPFTLVG